HPHLHSLPTRRSSDLDMKTPVILLLTNDPQLEETVAETLSENGGVSHLAYDPGDALQVVCGLGRHLDLAIIDFDHGAHGMTLLRSEEHTSELQSLAYL